MSSIIANSLLVESVSLSVGYPKNIYIVLLYCGQILSTLLSNLNCVCETMNILIWMRFFFLVEIKWLFQSFGWMWEEEVKDQKTIATNHKQYRSIFYLLMGKHVHHIMIRLHYIM